MIRLATLAVLAAVVVAVGAFFVLLRLLDGAEDR